MQKKLLVLAAGILQVPVIKKAKEMGIYVIAADGDPNAVGLKYADKAIVVNITSEEEVLKEDIHVYPAYYFDRPRYHTIEEVYCIHNHVYSWKEGGEHSNECELLEKPKKKDLFYYMYTMVNKYLAKKGLQIRISSI